MSAALEVPAFEQVYDAHFEVVWRTLRRMGVTAAQLDDAAQDVFLAVHRSLARFEGRSTVRTWVVGIALRVAKDYRRAASRKGVHQPLHGALVDAGSGPEVAAAAAQARAIVERVLLQLDETQREVLVLMELEQLTAPEVSEALNVNLSTVYSRLRLARKAFDVALAAWQERSAP